MVAGEYSPCHKAGPEMSQLGQPPQQNQGFCPFEYHNSPGGMSRLGEYSPCALLSFSLFFSLPSPSPSLLLPFSFPARRYRGFSVCSRWEIFIGGRERGKAKLSCPGKALPIFHRVPSVRSLGRQAASRLDHNISRGRPVGMAARSLRRSEPQPCSRLAVPFRVLVVSDCPS